MGYAADEAFGMAGDDEMHVEVQWQDADSSSSFPFVNTILTKLSHASCSVLVMLVVVTQRH